MQALAEVKGRQAAKLRETPPIAVRAGPELLLQVLRLARLDQHMIQHPVSWPHVVRAASTLLLQVLRSARCTELPPGLMQTPIAVGAGPALLLQVLLVAAGCTEALHPEPQTLKLPQCPSLGPASVQSVGLAALPVACQAGSAIVCAACSCACGLRATESRLVLHQPSTLLPACSPLAGSHTSPSQPCGALHIKRQKAAYALAQNAGAAGCAVAQQCTSKEADALAQQPQRADTSAARADQACTVSQPGAAAFGLCAGHAGHAAAAGQRAPRRAHPCSTCTQPGSAGPPSS